MTRDCGPSGLKSRAKRAEKPNPFLLTIDKMKPSIPKGTRDFSKSEMARRNYVFNTIKDVFRLYGYGEIQTPSMELLSTLMGKYGEEGDRLLFKVLNSGDFMHGVEPPVTASKICEKGLRYDLTVPFARYVVMHRGELQFPFKRSQVQPVWRADRPQKGRYREFYQCDADIVGSDSLLNEAELLQMAAEVFHRLGIRVEIHVNNRKILSGIASLIGRPELLVDITVAIDKIDKIGSDGVKAELKERGLTDQEIETIMPVIALSGDNQERLQQLKSVLAGLPDGEKGVQELETLLSLVQGLEVPVTLDVSLARGLNYYTGTIIEIKALDTPMGSISGGGRYDNLTGIFGLPGVSGVGISFGADRICDVMEALNLYPAQVGESVKIMLANLGETEGREAMKAVATLRKQGIAAELYPDAGKLKKQFSYANALSIPFVGIIGSDELENGTITLKDMTTGEQKQCDIQELTEILKN